jgi:hypothetical protein
MRAKGTALTNQEKDADGTYSIVYALSLRVLRDWREKGRKSIAT